ncbi:MAG: hypothetical protein AAF327_17325 [Cyanobacteria bacterium P01_A01_bin.37]
MNYNPTQFTPSLSSLPYSDYASTPEWVDTIAHVIWDDVLESPQHLDHFQVHEPGYVPKSWDLPGGWSIYDVQNDTWASMEVEQLPQCMVLDIESQQESKDGPWRPVMAIAMSSDAWYGWRWDGLGLPELIPFPDGRIVIGHNVRPYDARYLSCEYDLNAERTLYIDTRQLAIAWRGLVDGQVSFYKMCQKNIKSGKGAPDWYDHALMTSLKELSDRVLGKTIDKTVRGSLEKWNHADMIAHLKSKLALAAQQQLDDGQMTYGELTQKAAEALATFQDLAPTSLAAYCAQDVHATYQLFQSLWALSSKNLMPSVLSWTGAHEISNLKVLTSPIEKQREHDIAVTAQSREAITAELQTLAFGFTPDSHPHLDWSVFKSGPNKDKVKWLIQCDRDEWWLGCRSVVDLLCLTWDDAPIRWENRCWCANGNPIPHYEDSTKKLTVSPINWGYNNLVGTRLKSEVLGDRFSKFFVEAVIAMMPTANFDDAYVVDTDGLLINVAGVMPLSNTSHQVKHFDFLHRDRLDGCSLLNFVVAQSTLNVSIAEWIASTVANRSVKVKGDRTISNFLVCGHGSAKLIAEGLPDMSEQYLSENTQVEACLNDLAHKAFAKSPVLGWRISEAIDSKWATMLDGQVRREWLIESVKTDLRHVFLTILRAFVMEYELTTQLMDVYGSLSFQWLVLDDDLETFKQCAKQAWELAITASAEWMAKNLSEHELGGIPVKPQMPFDLTEVSLI